MKTQTVARGLAVFSVALGLLEVLASLGFCKTLGLKDQTRLVRLFGMREIAAGLGIFGATELGVGRLAPWLWARVVGDALDSAVLGKALLSSNPKRGNVALAIALVSPIIALDIWCALKLSTKASER